MNAQLDKPGPTPISLPAHVRQVVVFGGTFDPPHAQHTTGLLSHAAELLGKDGVVVYVPAARSPFKMMGPVATDADRISLLRLAIGSDERALIWTDELDRAAATPGVPSFMIDTLKRLRQVIDVGGRGGDIVLRLLIGADQAIAMHRWREYREVMRLAPPLLWLRNPIGDAESLARELKGSGVWSEDEIAEWRQQIAPLPLMDVSATEIRERLMKSTDPLNDAFLRRALPIRVLEAIASRRLYR